MDFANALLARCTFTCRRPAAGADHQFRRHGDPRLLVLVLFFIAIREPLGPDKPGALQHVAEWMNTFVSNQSEEMIGHGYETYISYLVPLGVFILTANLLGLIPGFEAPTAVPSVPLGCALVTWIFYHIHGLRKNGLIGYIKHFMGPVWWIAPLLFVIEIFSHLARIMSLTIRLYANMFAGDMVTLVFFSLVPLGFQSCSWGCISAYR